MPITLRPYQAEALDRVWAYFIQKPGAPIVALPTGTGKSVVIAELTKRLVSGYPGARVLMLTHVKELVRQNFEKLTALWPTAPAGIISAGLGRKESGYPVTFAGVQSVFRKPDALGKIDLVIVDECHLINDKDSTMYAGLLGALKKVNPRMRLCGMSATPYRMGQGLLTEGTIFDDICYDLTRGTAFIDLIAQGYLAPVVGKKTVLQLETEKIRLSGGEFVLSDLQEKCNIDKLNVAAIKESLALAANRNHILVFGTGIVHIEALADAFRRCGVSATCVHSKLPDKERDQRLVDFQAGRYRVMVSLGILTTGFDFPALDCIVMLRPTRSPSLWVQMVGRGTRPADGKKDCLVLDFAGNTERLGPINDPTLPRPKGKGGGGVAPVKVCPQCLTFCHASVRICSQCGYVFPATVKGITPTASSLDLISGADIVQKTFHPTRFFASRHSKTGRPDSLRIQYLCSKTVEVSVFLCLEHGGWASQKAAEIWGALTGGTETPKTVDDALKRISELMLPKNVVAYKQKGDKWWKFLNFCE